MDKWDSKIYERDKQLNSKYKEFIDSLDSSFCEKFYNELSKIFGEPPYVEWEVGQYDFNTTTQGFAKALENTVSQETYNYFYKDLEWYDSDCLDYEIEKKLINWFIDRLE